MERLDGESRTVWKGRISDLRVERWRHDDGEIVTREVSRHPGAVGIVAVDGDRLLLVRQPREAIGDPGLLEIAAGRMDVDGEEPLETAKRELGEEIGVRARSWTFICRYFSSPGFTDEEVHLYLARELEPLPEPAPTADEDERITIESVPLDRLDHVIEECRDAKTLIGLMWLRSRIAESGRQGPAIG